MNTRTSHVKLKSEAPTSVRFFLLEERIELIYKARKTNPNPTPSRVHPPTHHLASFFYPRSSVFIRGPLHFSHYRTNLSLSLPYPPAQKSCTTMHNGFVFPPAPSTRHWLRFHPRASPSIRGPLKTTERTYLYPSLIPHAQNPAQLCTMASFRHPPLPPVPPGTKIPLCIYRLKEIQ
jgi:hypothetical protein